MEQPLTAFERAVLDAMPASVVLGNLRSFGEWYAGAVEHHEDAAELQRKVVDVWIDLNLKHHSHR